MPSYIFKVYLGDIIVIIIICFFYVGGVRFGGWIKFVLMYYLYQYFQDLNF